MQKLKVRKIGNSLGVILPVELLAQLHVGEGEEVCVFNDENGIRLTPNEPGFDAVMAAFEKGRTQYRNALKKLAE